MQKIINNRLITLLLLILLIISATISANAQPTLSGDNFKNHLDTMDYALQLNSEISIADASANEADGTMTFDLTINPPTSDQVTLNVATTDGTAWVSIDYNQPATSLVIDMGESSASITVPLIDDSEVESDEDFVVTISHISGSATVTDSGATGTIVSDDLPPASITISDASATEDSGVVNFTITLDRAVDTSITLSAQTMESQALSGFDFMSISPHETIIIPANTTSFTLPVRLIDDPWKENDEFFFIIISMVSGDATITVPNATATILANDPSGKQEPALVFMTPESIVDENDGEVSVLLGLNKPAQKKIVIAVSTAENQYATAQAGVDYTAQTDVLVTIPANGLSVEFTVPLINDNISEPFEILGLTYRVVSGPAMTDANALGLAIINDDDLTGPVGLTINNVTALESAGSGMLFTVSATNLASTDIVLTLSTAETGAAPATEGVDFTSIDGTQVTLPAGQDKVLFPVPVIFDHLVEASETFSVTIEVSSGNAVILDGEGIGKLTNNTTASVIPLLTNSGFEISGMTPWKVMRASGAVNNDNLKCSLTTPLGDGTPCAFVFVGGAGENTKLSQRVNLNNRLFSSTDTLQLIASYKTKKATNLKITTIVTFTGGIPKQKIILLLNNATANQWVTVLSAPTLLESTNISTINVQAVFAMTSGTVSLDNVALYHIYNGIGDTSGFRRLDSIPSGDTLPLPDVRH